MATNGIERSKSRHLARSTTWRPRFGEARPRPYPRSQIPAIGPHTGIQPRVTNGGNRQPPSAGDTFDYIVTGAGLAGCAVAARLSGCPGATACSCWKLPA